MNRKKIMALVMAMAMVGMVAAPSITSEAAGLTQATDPSQVVYGTVSEEDIELLRTLFDAEWYLKENPELADFFGNDTEALFKHFYKCGLFEGRTCSSLFDPAAYASAYGDLEAMYGNNILKYYEHYIKSTPEEKELRPLTTVAACAQAGVTVHSMVSSDVQITPIAYMIAERLGTNDYGAVQSAINTAVASAKTSGGSGSAERSEAGETVVVTPDDTGEAVIVTPADSESALLAQAKGLQLVGTITIESDYGCGMKEISIYRGVTEGTYAAYAGYVSDINTVPVQTIGAYTAAADSSNADMLDWNYQIAYFDTGAVVAGTSTASGMYGDNAPTSGNIISNPLTIGVATAESENCTSDTSFEFPNEVVPTVTEKAFVDENGTATTSYNVTINLENATSTSVDATIGVYSENTGFAYVGEYTIDASNAGSNAGEGDGN